MAQRCAPPNPARPTPAFACYFLCFALVAVAGNVAGEPKRLTLDPALAVDFCIELAVEGGAGWRRTRPDR